MMIVKQQGMEVLGVIYPHLCQVKDLSIVCPIIMLNAVQHLAGRDQDSRP